MEPQSRSEMLGRSAQESAGLTLEEEIDALLHDDRDDQKVAPPGADSSVNLSVLERQREQLLKELGDIKDESMVEENLKEGCQDVSMQGESLEELQQSVLSLCEDGDTSMNSSMMTAANGETRILDPDDIDALENEIMMLCHDQYYTTRSSKAAEKYDDLVEQIMSFCENDDMDISQIPLPQYQLKSSAVNVSQTPLPDCKFKSDESASTGDVNISQIPLPNFESKQFMENGEFAKLSSDNQVNVDGQSRSLSSASTSTPVKLPQNGQDRAEDDPSTADLLQTPKSTAVMKISKIDIQSIIATPERTKILPKIDDDKSGDDSDDDDEDENVLKAPPKETHQSPAVSRPRAEVKMANALSTPVRTTPSTSRPVSSAMTPLSGISPIVKSTPARLREAQGSPYAADTPGRFTHVKVRQYAESQNANKENDAVATSLEEKFSKSNEEEKTESEKLTIQPSDSAPGREKTPPDVTSDDHTAEPNKVNLTAGIKDEMDYMLKRNESGSICVIDEYVSEVNASEVQESNKSKNEVKDENVTEMSFSEIQECKDDDVKHENISEMSSSEIQEIKDDKVEDDEPSVIIVDEYFPPTSALAIDKKDSVSSKSESQGDGNKILADSNKKDIPQPSNVDPAKIIRPIIVPPKPKPTETVSLMGAKFAKSDTTKSAPSKKDTSKTVMQKSDTAARVPLLEKPTMSNVVSSAKSVKDNKENVSTTKTGQVKKFFQNVAGKISNIVNTKFKEPLAAITKGKSNTDNNNKTTSQVTSSKTSINSSTALTKEISGQETVTQNKTTDQNLSLFDMTDASLQSFLIDNESELMKQVRQQWKLDGILSPEINLTYASYWHKRNKKKSILGKSRLEGDSTNTSCLTLNSDFNSDSKSKKRKRTDNDSFISQKRPCPNNRTHQQALRLKSEAESQIEQDFRTRVQKILLSNEQRNKELLRCHQLQQRELYQSQQAEKQSLWNRSQFNYQLNQNVNYHLGLLQHEHKNQFEAMEQTHMADMQQLIAHCRQRIQVEKDRHMQRIRFTLDTIAKQKEVSQVFVPNDSYVCVYIQKHHARPLRDTEEHEDEVYLPSSIAKKIQEEDRLYDSLYVYQ